MPRGGPIELCTACEKEVVPNESVSCEELRIEIEGPRVELPKQPIDLTTNKQQLTITIILEGLKIEALIDSRVHINIINNILVQI